MTKRQTRASEYLTKVISPSNNADENTDDTAAVIDDNEGDVTIGELFDSIFLTLYDMIQEMREDIKKLKEHAQQNGET